MAKHIYEPIHVKKDVGGGKTVELITPACACGKWKHTGPVDSGIMRSKLYLKHVKDS